MQGSLFKSQVRSLRGVQLKFDNEETSGEELAAERQDSLGWQHEQIERIDSNSCSQEKDQDCSDNNSNNSNNSNNTCENNDNENNSKRRLTLAEQVRAKRQLRGGSLREKLLRRRRESEASESSPSKPSQVTDMRKRRRIRDPGAPDPFARRQRKASDFAHFLRPQASGDAFAQQARAIVERAAQDWSGTSLLTDKNIFLVARNRVKQLAEQYDGSARLSCSTKQRSRLGSLAAALESSVLRDAEFIHELCLRFARHLKQLALRLRHTLCLPASTRFASTRSRCSWTLESSESHAPLQLRREARSETRSEARSETRSEMRSEARSEARSEMRSASFEARAATGQSAKPHGRLTLRKLRGHLRLLWQLLDFALSPSLEDFRVRSSELLEPVQRIAAEALACVASDSLRVHVPRAQFLTLLREQCRRARSLAVEATCLKRLRDDFERALQRHCVAIVSTHSPSLPECLDVATRVFELLGLRDVFVHPNRVDATRGSTPKSRETSPSECELVEIDLTGDVAVVSTAKPSEATAKPSEAIAKPSEAHSKPSEASAKPSEATAKPSEIGEAARESSEATAESSEATAESSEAQLLAKVRRHRSLLKALFKEISRRMLQSHLLQQWPDHSEPESESKFESKSEPEPESEPEERDVLRDVSGDNDGTGDWLRTRCEAAWHAAVRLSARMRRLRRFLERTRPAARRSDANADLLAAADTAVGETCRLVLCRLVQALRSRERQERRNEGRDYGGDLRLPSRMALVRLDVLAGFTPLFTPCLPPCLHP
ncbi:MAG: hypothetical protein MHM6MM_007704, partial [Cercozoa sp. M6MM]